MKTKSVRAVSAAALTALFLPQSIGAADLAMLASPPARPLVFPPPARQGPTLSQRLAQFAAEWMKTRPEETPPPAPKVVLPPAPVEPPTPDRILLKNSDGVVGVAPSFDLIDPEPLAGVRPVFAPRFSGPWTQGRGIRFRISYLRPAGVSWGDSEGYHAKIFNAVMDYRASVPPRYWRRFPLYFSRDRVPYEIELENTGDRTLEGLEVSALQEGFNPAGGPGPVLLEPKARLRLASLKPGQRAVLKHSFQFSHLSIARISFEQTHVGVTQDGRTLADEPQAGIVDPPNF